MRLSRPTVLSVAYPFALVGPDAVGGAEQVLSRVEAALVHSGARSLTLAMEGSAVVGELIPFSAPAGMLDSGTLAGARRRFAELLRRTLSREKVDVVHYHGIDFAEIIPEDGPPALATLHLPPSWYPPRVFRPDWRHGLRINYVSRSQEASAPPRAHSVGVVQNGVDPGGEPSTTGGAGALMIGRICPEKGFHLGLRAARLAGSRATLAGRVFPFREHLDYFRDRLEPAFGPGADFVGPADEVRKRELLDASDCLLIPSLAPETSSLVAMEAMMRGRPVIAFKTGALPEIIEDEVTGALVEDVEGMARAMRNLDRFDPTVIRAVALKRFSADRMTRSYIEILDGIAAAGRGRASGLREGAVP